MVGGARGAPPRRPRLRRADAGSPPRCAAPSGCSCLLHGVQLAAGAFDVALVEGDAGEQQVHAVAVELIAILAEQRDPPRCDAAPPSCASRRSTNTRRGCCLNAFSQSFCASSTRPCCTSASPRLTSAGTNARSVCTTRVQSASAAHPDRPARAPPGSEAAPGARARRACASLGSVCRYSLCTSAASFQRPVSR